MDYNRSSTDLSAVVVSAISGGYTPGQILPFQTASQLSSQGGGGTIAGVLFPPQGGTFRFIVGGGDAPTPTQTSLVTVQLAWQAAVAGTITLKTCNFPAHVGGKIDSGAVDVSDFDTTFWVPQTPPSGFFVPVTGTGNSVSATMVVTAGGLNLGNTEFTIGNTGHRRVALELVLTAGGIVRANACGKLGA